MFNLCMAICLLALSACAPISEIKALRRLDISSFRHLEPDDVTYSDHYRSMVMVNKETTTGKDRKNGISRDQKEVPLFNEDGQKVRTKEELDQLIRANSVNKSTPGEKFLFGATMVWTVPVGLATSFINTLLGIPAAPWVFHTYHKLQERSFREYKDGTAALEQGNAKLAQQHFFNALDVGIRMAQWSDVYFKLALAYKLDGNQEQERLYFQRFLDFSVRLYPDYFEKYDSSLKNDLHKLSAEFQEAEKELASLKN